jgi:hypothetical protein
MLPLLLSAAALAAASPAPDLSAAAPAPPAYADGMYHGLNAHGGRTIAMVSRGRIVRWGQALRGRCDDGTVSQVRATSGSVPVPIDADGDFDRTKRVSRYIRWRMKGHIEGGEMSGRFWAWFEPASDDGRRRRCIVADLAWSARSASRPTASGSVARAAGHRHAPAG